MEALPRAPVIDRPFVGIPSFLRAPVCSDIAGFKGLIAILGFPFDEGSPFMPGTRFGPRSMREHSLRFGSSGYFHPELRRDFLAEECKRHLIEDVGDVDIAPTNVEQTFANATALTRELSNRAALLVVLGGDHSITFPVVRGIGKKVHIIHFDAHLDFEPFTHGLQYTNAHAFRHVHSMPHVESITQIGIRSIRHTREVFEDATRLGNSIITMADFRAAGLSSVLQRIPSDSCCYVSIDLDVLDMSLIPGCVSGEPNGMTFLELRNSLLTIAEHYEVVGFDLVEVNPLLDVATGATSYLGAHLVVEFMGQICDQPRWGARRDAVPGRLKS